MRKKRYKNVFQKYISDMIIFDMDCKCKDKITEQEFTENAYKKIDLFIKYLYNSMSSDLKDDDKTILLCKVIQKVLKDNVYNNNVNVFDFLYNVFQIPDDKCADYGLFPSFSYSYHTNLMIWGNDLVIQVIFESPQSIDEGTPVFQIRCHYSQMEGQYNDNFKEYFDNSNNFLTTEDFMNFYGFKKEDNEYCEDTINIDIVQLSYCKLYSDLYEKDTLNDNINEFHKDMSNVIGL